jgi:hypothetical protein
MRAGGDEAKRAVMTAMKVAEEGEVKQLKAELKVLLEGRGGMGVSKVIKVVEKAVEEDCEKRGCLWLSTVPEFTAEWKSKRSGRWSWTD